MLKLIRNCGAGAIARVMAGVIAGLIALGAAPAMAEEADDLTYTIQKNDTLYAIKDRFLLDSVNVNALRDYNAVRNTRGLRINSTIRIPREMLDFTPVGITVFRLSGPVSIAGVGAEQDQFLNEGDLIETRRNGFVTLETSEGGRISLPSNTTVRLVRARRYTLGNTLDLEFKVERGRASASSPSLEGRDRLQMRTPLAVTAVRGTDFRVAYDPENGDLSLTEVTEGEVNVAAGGEQAAASAGFGIVSSADGVSEPRALLAAPAIIDGGAIQTGEVVEFAIEPVIAAVGYRVQLAREAGFLDVISEQRIDGEQATFTDIENDRYFVRARAIAADGLEGSSEAYSFRRKQLGVAASAGAGDDYDGFKFAWRADGEGESLFAFQLWEEGNPQTLLIDEVGLTETEVILTDLDRGRYKWRVAVAQADAEEGLLKIWGGTETLVITE